MLFVFFEACTFIGSTIAKESTIRPSVSLPSTLRKRKDAKNKDTTPCLQPHAYNPMLTQVSETDLVSCASLQIYDSSRDGKETSC